MRWSAPWISVSIYALLVGAFSLGCDSSSALDRLELVSLRLEPTELVIDDGTSGLLRLRQRDASGNIVPLSPNMAVQWTSSDPDVAVADAKGEVQALAPGSATITATVLLADGSSVRLSSEITIRQVATRIELLEGDDQSGIVAEPLADPIVARVLDRAGRPVPGAEIVLTPLVNSDAQAAASPNGSASWTATTDASGTSQTTWTLGTAAGVQQVQLGVQGRNVHGPKVKANAQPAAPDGWRVVSGDQQSGSFGGILLEPLVARVVDRFGNGVAGIALTWTVRAGGGSILSSSQVTGADGTTTAIWRLGPQLGTNEIVAISDAVPSAALFTATAKGPPASRVQIKHGATLSAIGATVTLEAIAYGPDNTPLKDASLQWTSLQPNIASVDGSGQVTAVANGTANIVATVDGKADTVAVRVQQTVSTLSVAPEKVTLATVGATSQLNYTAADANGNPVSGTTPAWSSSAPAIATVDASGRVTARQEGIAEVTVSVNNLVASASVTVGSSESEISLNPAAANLAVGDTIRLEATMMDASGHPVSPPTLAWSSSAPNIAAVSPAGVVSAVGVGSAVITASAAGVSSSAQISVTSPGPTTIASVVITPRGDTINAIGAQSQLTAAARDSSGAVVTGAPITWTSLQSSIATVDGTGKVTARSIGTAWIVALSAGCADTVVVNVRQVVAAVTVSPSALTLAPGSTQALTAQARDAAGVPVPSAPIEWSSSQPSIATVSAAGTVSAVSTGTAIITAASGDQSAQAAITVSNDVSPPGPPAEGSAFIIGPQVPLGQSPWPFFDDTHAGKAAEHHQTAMTTADDSPYVLANYYDLGLSLYVLYQRSGNPAHLAMARDVADKWHERNRVRAMTTGQQPAPRNASISGVILRALDGRPDMWEWITAWQRLMWPVWLGARLDNASLWQGIRDGGYTLLYTAQLAQVHPDAAVRNEMRNQALAAARDYYARLQNEDGGWYWYIPPIERVSSQPFMVGMLLEGLIATHQVTGDAVVAQSILRAVDWLYDVGYEQQPVTNLTDVRWRAMKYFIDNPPRTDAMRYGTPQGAIRSERQLNAVTIHAFGYAYQITGDTKYRDWADDIFAATFGRGQGPGADPYWALADATAKEYNQSYRTAGRYLAWRSTAP